MNAAPPWLADIPPDWSMKPLGFTVGVVGGATPSKENPEFWDGSVPWVSPKDMKSFYLDDSEDHITEQALDGSSLRLVKPPAVLMVIRGMILAHTVPVAVNRVPVTINQDMKALLPGGDYSARFLAYLLRAASPALLEMVEEAGHGTRCLRTEVWAKLRLPVPPRPLQDCIVAMLDRRSADLNGVISTKQRMLGLLREKRQALITRLVTRGLGDGRRLKDLGILGLGAVPEHWKVGRLKHLADVQLGLTLGKDYDTRTLVERPYLRVANVQSGFLDLSDITTVWLPAEDVPRYELRPGDVLMTEGGDADKLGRGYVWEGQFAGCLHQNHVFVVRPDSTRLEPHYLASLMTSEYGRDYFTRTAHQTTNLASTNSSKLRDFPILLPTLGEQVAILKELQRGLEHTDAVARHIVAQLGELREYRQALITAAVSGKLDIRQKAAV